VLIHLSPEFKKGSREQKLAAKIGGVRRDPKTVGKERDILTRGEEKEGASVLRSKRKGWNPRKQNGRVTESGPHQRKSSERAHGKFELPGGRTRDYERGKTSLIVPGNSHSKHNEPSK